MVVQGESAALLQPHATRVGGVMEFVRIAELASVADLPVCPHAGDMMQAHQHLVFAARTAHRFEHIPWGRELVVDPARVEDGALRRPTTPGAGTAMHEDVVEKYLAATPQVRSWR